jgi:ABC-type bacteriocin/lantibiotic exporter with double-glycine peptidase domain
LRNALRAQIRAIVAREGLSTASGIISLIIVFLAVIYAGMESRGDTATLIALAATLPKQIDLANDVHGLASAWNDLVAIWTRIGGATEHFLPEADPEFNERIKFEQLVFSDDGAQLPVANFDAALALATTQPLGRINLRGSNGAGKSTVLAALKSALGPNAYYWPTTDRLSYKFADGVSPEADAELEDDEAQEEEKPAPQTKSGFSSGERQIQSLQEIVATTAAPIYLLDEWDANLDGQNRAIAQALIDTLAKRARVIEISHRDRAVVNVDADG